MSFNEVTTLFHEFGHGLQGMLTTVDYKDAAGINGIEWDAVEVASQFMENWCYHKPTLIGMTKHVETGETLPDALFDKLCAARTFRAGSVHPATGIRHDRYDTPYRVRPNGEDVPFRCAPPDCPEFEPAAAATRIAISVFLQPYFAGSYAAGYYSYKWAEVLSADAFSAFEEAGLEDEAALLPRWTPIPDTILACGGGRDPMKVFHDFRGRGPSTDCCGITG